MAPIVIFGAGEHGRIALQICEAAGLAVRGFLDADPQKGPQVDGLPILGGEELLTDSAFLAAHDLLPGLGDQGARLQKSMRAQMAGARFATAIHPSAIVSPRAAIGAGTLVGAGGVINTGARIGGFCIVNTRASVDHDCVLRDGVQIGPGAILCGRVDCGEQAYVGAGAVILPGRRLGAGSVAGAGAVVTRDVAPGVTVVGNPAKPMA